MMRRGGSKKAALTPELQRKRMLTVPIPKLIIGMIIPTVLSQLITVIYNTADTFFVARIGTSAAAAVGVVFSLQSIMQAYGFGVGTGCGGVWVRPRTKKQKAMPTVRCWPGWSARWSS